MNQSKSFGLWCRLLLGASALLLGLSGCGSDGNDGATGPVGPPGPPGAPAPASATSLSITVDSVTIASPPVVDFTVTNQDGSGVPGLADSDLRFNIAKLIPASASPHGTSQWQNYIVTGGSAMHGSQERFRDRPTDVWGELVDHGDGTYTYTFETDITNVTCPAPCTEADGTPLDLSYQPGLTHRVSIQQGNSALPQENAVYDFVPAGGAVTSERLIVKTANCNECHDKITAHGSRFETKLCVTCHNPGSWADADTPVDFKVMIHRIHRGENLPSVEAGGSYAVGSHDFSDIVFPQDIRNCTKCHDGSDPETPQGNAWQTPNMEACGSCHDDIDFSKDGAVDPAGHPGGIVSDNTECTTCHAENRIAGSVAASHTVPGKAERALFQFNILEICGTAAGSNPTCPPTVNPTVKFSVTDPSGATTHEYGNAYNVKSTGTDEEFSSSAASLNILIAWDTRDYTNEGGTGTRPSRADSINVRTSTAVTDNGDGTFTLDGAAASPVEVIPATAAGTGAIAMEGHPAADDGTGAFTVRVPVNSEVSYFAITDSTPQPRRQVVDVPTKCDRCHDVLNVHGSNRNNNGQLCVLCHNPSNTDVSQRPKDGTTGLPLVSPVDGKQEESIDFKRLIHGIHAASASNFDGTDAHGFRTKGLVIYGFGGSANDFSDVRFPGVLSKCETCHLPDTYTLADRSADGGGNWELPAMNGIKGSTVNSFQNALADGSDFDAQLIDQSDDWKYSPIASVCTACHDGTLEQQHMLNNGAILGGAGSEQVVQEGNIESCPVCHGPGKLADVKLVHDEAFENFLGEFIP
ncbi:MAG: OmcA/MtrC family decaheme c-type cytochrome [Thiogranum sp.]